MAPRGKELLGDQHRKGRADGAAHDSEHPAAQLELKKFGVIAGPADAPPSGAGRAQPTDYVAIGI